MSKIIQKLSNKIFGQGSYIKSSRSSTDLDVEGTLEDYEKAYKTDDVVRQCVNLIAFFSTQQGFETQLELKDEDADPEEYLWVKRKVDEINKRVNLDKKLMMAKQKSQIYGYTGFEIVYDEEGLPARLVPLRSQKLQPVVDDNYYLQGFKYTGIEDDFEPHEVLYFTHDQLEYDQIGLSAVEPIFQIVNAKKTIRDNLKKAAKRLWAPVNIHQIDTSQLTEEEARRKIRSYKTDINAGENIVTNQSVETETIKMDPNYEAAVKVLEKFDEEIAGNFGVPKALLSRSKTVNRATLEFSLKAMYEGQIAAAQQEMRRELEAQWYDMIVERLGEQNNVRVKHKWKPVSLLDFMELADPIVDMKEAGIIDTEKAWDILGWDHTEIKTKDEGTIQTRFAPWDEKEEESDNE